MRGHVRFTRSTHIHEKISHLEVNPISEVPMKTLLLQNKNDYLLVTVPYYMKISSKLLSELFEFSNSKAKKYRLAKYIPTGLKMNNGYFHPFYSEELNIKAGIFLPNRYLEFQISAELSVRLYYEEVKEILRKYYKDYKILELQ